MADPISSKLYETADVTLGFQVHPSSHYFMKDKRVQSLVQKEGFPKNFTDYYKHFSNAPSHIVVQIVKNEVVYVPGNELLQRQCTHYFAKYEISMEVVDIAKLSDLLKEKISSSCEATTLGIILSDESKAPEVNSFIIRFEKDQGKVLWLSNGIKQAIPPRVDEIFQSFGGNCPYPISLSTLNRTPVSKATTRVRDLITLRNALLFLKDEPTKLDNLAKSQCSDIPLLWEYTDRQLRWADLNTLTDTYVIRAFNSKKGEKLESIEDFRKRHEEKLDMDCSLICHNRDKSHTPPPPEFPEGVTLTGHGGESTRLNWSCTESMNTYLIRKGYKLIQE